MTKILRRTCCILVAAMFLLAPIPCLAGVEFAAIPSPLRLLHFEYAMYSADLVIEAEIQQQGTLPGFVQLRVTDYIAGGPVPDDTLTIFHVPFGHRSFTQGAKCVEFLHRCESWLYYPVLANLQMTVQGDSTHEEVSSVRSFWPALRDTLVELASLTYIDSLAARADLCLVGTVSDVNFAGPVPWWEQQSGTVAVTVQEAYLSASPPPRGATVELEFLHGGPLHSRPLFAVGEEYMLFLTPSTGGRYRLLGGARGAWLIQGDSAVRRRPVWCGAEGYKNAAVEENTKEALLRYVQP